MGREGSMGREGRVEHGKGGEGGAWEGRGLRGAWKGRGACEGRVDHGKSSGLPCPTKAQSHPYEIKAMACKRK